MLTSLSFVFLLGLAMAALCQKFKIPRIIGMLVTGILLGPCVLNWLSELILGISSELRQMALIIILLKAGLSDRKSTRLNSSHSVTSRMPSSA